MPMAEYASAGSNTPVDGAPPVESTGTALFLCRLSVQLGRMSVEGLEDSLHPLRVYYN